MSDQWRGRLDFLSDRLLASVKEGTLETSYEYDEVSIFKTPLFVDGSVHVPVIEKETNPLGGVIKFFYYKPSFEEVSAGFSNEYSRSRFQSQL